MLLALATPKLCERFSFVRVSPFPLQREGRPAGGLGGCPSAAIYSENVPHLLTQAA